MTKKIIPIIILLLSFVTLQAQTTKAVKKNVTIKEYTQKAGSKTQILDHTVTYDNLGRKVEEVEYASYGQKSRVVFDYEGNSMLCIREVVYNDKNAVTKIRKTEYNSDGTKKTQSTYGPDGKLRSTRTYEYVK